jgi:hypothetical protein
MAKLKYSKYFLNELPEEKQKAHGKLSGVVAFTDNDVIEDSYAFGVRVMGTRAMGAAHGPHTHIYPELLVALGIDMANPKDLGAEIEMCMGPEMESHIITESTLIWIPANFIHCPFRILKVTRPFLFAQCQYGHKMQEKSYKKLVPEELRSKMIFIDTDDAPKDS